LSSYEAPERFTISESSEGIELTTIQNIRAANNSARTHNYQYLYNVPKPDTNSCPPANKQERQLKIAIVYKTIKLKK
jgi:hypothetical protein